MQEEGTVSHTAVEESGSDSGMGSPIHPEGGAVLPENTESGGDSEDEILVNRKSRCRKALRDSEGEEEAEPANILVLSESSEEEEQGLKRKTGGRISRAALDSEDSETETGQGDGQDSPAALTPQRESPLKRQKQHYRLTEERGKERSQRRKEKDEKRLKKKVNQQDEEVSSAPPTLSDSGCLLGDSDLFDTGLGEEEEEEESLDAIRAAVRHKVKKHQERPMTSELEEEEEEREGDEEEGGEGTKKEEEGAEGGPRQQGGDEAASQREPETREGFLSGAPLPPAAAQNHPRLLQEAPATSLPGECHGTAQVFKIPAVYL